VHKGNCLANAEAESFFSNLKNELVHHVVFEDRDQACLAIFEYMEVFYNRERIYQLLGFTTCPENQGCLRVTPFLNLTSLHPLAV
jgi:transposase InsO family protein